MMVELRLGLGPIAFSCAAVGRQARGLRFMLSTAMIKDYRVERVLGSSQGP